MADIAQLGYRVDTSGLKKGTRALNDMDAAGKRVEKSSKGIVGSLRSVGGVLAAFSSGIL